MLQYCIFRGPTANKNDVSATITGDHQNSGAPQHVHTTFLFLFFLGGGRQMSQKSVTKLRHMYFNSDNIFLTSAGVIIKR